ncbi:hypothetical protein ACQR10_28410 [Bradyrhizobium sp. HKCCYLRH2060]|uniref:hypothetical protein n=1 Tax=Bradyrhizobium TaxID=374 RepID=UPI003EB72697
MAVVAQYIVKPQPGSDLAELINMTAEIAALWRTFGGNVKLWSPSVGEVGNLVLAVGFQTFKAYGDAVDKLYASKAFHDWQAKRLKSGMTEWVRDSVAVEISI